LYVKGKEPTKGKFHMKAKKINKIYYEMFVTSSAEENKGNVGEVVMVNVTGEDKIAYVQWFQGECDMFTFDWMRENLYELVDEDEEEED